MFDIFIRKIDLFKDVPFLLVNKKKKYLHREANYYQ